MTATVVLPGTQIDPSQLPQTSSNRALTIGPGLRYLPPSTILTTTAGTLHADDRKKALWLDNTALGGRYLPAPGDLVIAQIHHSSTDTYHVSLTPYTPLALLGQLSFEGATKKTRPQLVSGDIVYARVVRADKWGDVEVECVSAHTGKSEGLGPLKGGMVFDVSAGFARRLMMGAAKGGVVVLEALGEKIKFEVAVGRNGRVWVDAASVGEVVKVGLVLRQVDDKGLDDVAQRKLVNNTFKG